MAPRIVVVGASLGGLSALQAILPGLPRDFAPAVVLVLHRRRDTGDSLARMLAKHCALALEEVQDKTAVSPGRIFLAPADYHTMLEEGHFALATDAPVGFARPSIDVLFETAAEAYGNRAVGVILTGAGDDGARGMAAIKRHGGITLVQEPETSERGDMPGAALAMAGPVDAILPLPRIAPFLVRLCEAD